MNPSSHFVYQRAHTLGGKALHLAEHLRIAARAFEHIYGSRPEFDEREIAATISGFLKTLHLPARTSSTVLLYFVPREDGGCEVRHEYERSLLDAGYAHSPLRPKAVTYEYAIPYCGFPTGFQLSARALFDSVAFRQHGAARSVRREGDRLLSCGDAPLFALRGHVLFTPPLTEGAMDSVERELVIAAAGGVKPRLEVREEAIAHSELKSFDELFCADAAGITSLAECDGAKFMSLAAARLAAAMGSDA
jgi:hypothetical protein